MAEELAKLPRATGAAGPGRGKAGSKAGLAFSDAPTLAELGVDRKRAARAKKLGELGTAKIISARSYLLMLALRCVRKGYRARRKFGSLTRYMVEQ
jgi:hypothetical protein